MTEKELPQGISHLTQKLANNPTSRAFVPLADEYLRQNLLDEAILVLTSGIQRHPTYVAARMMLGKAYQRAERVTEAKREFEEVTRLHPENVLAYKKLALLYREAGQLGEAVEMCNKVLLIDPHDNKAKMLLASVQEEISLVEDREDEIISDWPPLTSQDTLPSQDTLASQGTLPSHETFPLEGILPELPFETEMAEHQKGVYSEGNSIIAEQYPDGIPVTNDSFKNEYFPATESREVPSEDLLVEALPFGERAEEESPMEFAGKREYNRASLHQKRLEEWLVSIQEKGVRR